MSELYENLTWLLPQPNDFFAQCRLLESNIIESGELIQSVASFALDVNALLRLAKTINSLKNKSVSLDPLLPFRLGVISNGTVDYLQDSLIATAPRFGINLEVISTSFDQTIQACIDPKSTLYSSKLDAVLVAIDFRGFGLRAVFGDAKQVEVIVENAFHHLKTIQSSLHAGGIPIILQTIAPPPELIFGNIDAVVQGTIRWMSDLINSRIHKEFSGAGTTILDIEMLAQTVGLSKWHDPTQWGLARLPCAFSMVPLYADHICRTVAALRGLSRRVLILDLDNTLWGGVIGDDGIAGISVAQGDPTGEAHLALQKYALDLRKRGIILAVCSKNDYEVALRPFREHPDMLLKEQNFAVFQANWSDKANNIRLIANSLDIGLGSLVFVDDNPAERELIRQKLPQVAVPELPSDPSFYVRTLSAAGYFEAVSFTYEDQARALLYENNMRSFEIKNDLTNLESYLKSLSMKAIFSSFDSISRSRVTQLINKSNQFNLTTRRYTELQVEEFERDPSIFTLHVRLLDKFGDNGLIGVVICRKIEKSWIIDTWLMSCRVLKRRVEEAMLRCLVKCARHSGIKELIGVYIPTNRNSIVKDHYPNLGFKQFLADGESLDDLGQTNWRLILDDYYERNLPITLDYTDL